MSDDSDDTRPVDEVELALMVAESGGRQAGPNVAGVLAIAVRTERAEQARLQKALTHALAMIEQPLPRYSTPMIDSLLEALRSASDADYDGVDWDQIDELMDAAAESREPML